HADVSIDGLDYAEADFGLAVVGNAVHVLQQHRREFLERNQPLPLQLVDPLVQVVDHPPSVAAFPQPLQAVVQQVFFEDPPVQLEQAVQLPTVCLRQVLPAAQQQP